MDMNEELNAIQEAVETAAEEDVELSTEDLSQVTGGYSPENARYDIFFLCPNRRCPTSVRGYWFRNIPLPDDSNMPACYDCGTRMYIQRMTQIS